MLLNHLESVLLNRLAQTFTYYSRYCS